MRRRALIAALALTTVSCGAGGSSAGAAAPAATQPPSQLATGPVAVGSYDSVRAMQLDVEAAFYLCTAPMKVYDPPLIEGALAQADCSKDVRLLIFNPDDVQTSAAALQAAADGPLTLLVGVNWIITCSAEKTCQKIQGKTGGELITTP